MLSMLFRIRIVRFISLLGKIRCLGKMGSLVYNKEILLYHPQGSITEKKNHLWEISVKFDTKTERQSLRVSKEGSPWRCRHQSIGLLLNKQKCFLRPWQTSQPLQWILGKCTWMRKVLTVLPQTSTKDPQILHKTIETAILVEVHKRWTEMQ